MRTRMVLYLLYNGNTYIFINGNSSKHKWLLYNGNAYISINGNSCKQKWYYID